jgi:hypothetical protein
MHRLRLQWALIMNRLITGLLVALCLQSAHATEFVPQQRASIQQYINNKAPVVLPKRLPHIKLAQSLLLLGAGGTIAPSYIGPGDVLSGAVAWWGLRCYNAAFSGNMVDVADAATGSTTGTRLQCAAGNVITALSSASACTFVTGNACSSLATTCAISCNIVTLYDQSGNKNCTVGVAACDVTQATNTNRMTFISGCVGSLPCMTNTGVRGLVSSANFTSLAVPYTIVSAQERTSGTNIQSVVRLASAGNYFGGAANIIECVSGSSNAVNGVSDNVWHVVQNALNSAGTNTNCIIDGTTNNFANSVATGTGAVSIGGDNFSQFLKGNIVEVGIWPTEISGTPAVTMNSNIHSYWGF